MGTRRGGSNEYQQSMFLSRNMIYDYIGHFHLLMIKFSVYFNRRNVLVRFISIRLGTLCFVKKC